MRWIYFFGYRLLLVYWFLFRPRVFGVKCIVQNGDQVLLIRNSYGPAGWTFPGGGVSNGEAPANAAIRETQEEVGIVVQDVRFRGEYLFTKEYKKDYVSVFSAIVDSKDFVIDNKEVVEAKWFAMAEMPTLTLHAQEAWRIFMNKRAAAIIIQNNKILLMHRFTQAGEYWVFPGGGVEENETEEEAMKREVAEELSLTVKISKPMFEVFNPFTMGKYPPRQEYYYLVTEFSGAVKLGGNEAVIMSQTDQFYPTWVELAKIKFMENLHPEVARKKLVEVLEL